MCITFFLFLLNFSYSQISCPPAPSLWKKNINKDTIVWFFVDEGVLPVTIDGIKDISNSVKVRNAIKDAIDIWLRAIGKDDMGNNLLTFIEGSYGSNYDIYIGFEPALKDPDTQKELDIWGETTDDFKTIKLFYSDTRNWSTTGSTNNITNDLTTVLAHEFGHVFLGKGHYDIPGEQTLMREAAGVRVFWRLHECEVNIVRNFYKFSLVNLANRNLSEEMLGGYLKVNARNFVSGSSIKLRKGFYNFITDERLATNVTYKHINWNKLNNRFFLLIL